MRPSAAPNAHGPRLAAPGHLCAALLCAALLGWGCSTSEPTELENARFPAYLPAQQYLAYQQNVQASPKVEEQRSTFTPRSQHIYNELQQRLRVSQHRIAERTRQREAKRVYRDQSNDEDWRALQQAAAIELEYRQRERAKYDQRSRRNNSSRYEDQEQQIAELRDAVRRQRALREERERRARELRLSRTRDLLDRIAQAQQRHQDETQAETEARRAYFEKLQAEYKRLQRRSKEGAGGTEEEAP